MPKQNPADDAITIEEALPLLDSHEWWYTAQVPLAMDELIEVPLWRCLKDEQLFASLLETAPRPMARDAVASNRSRIEQVLLPQRPTVVKALSDFLQDGADAKTIQQPPLSLKRDVSSELRGEIRLGGQAGKIVKVGPTIKAVTGRGLSIIGSVLTLSRWELFSLTATTISVATNAKALVAALCSAYERLDNPRECFVFEAVFFLQGKYTVINYDALVGKDFESAYAHLIPSVSDIEAAVTDPALSNLVPEEWCMRVEGAGSTRYEPAPREQWIGDLREVMYELKQRSVLKEKDGRWSIVW